MPPKAPIDDPAADLVRAADKPGSLSSPATSSKFTETKETPAGEAARLGKEKTILNFSLGVIVLFFAFCAYMGAFNPKATESDKKWAFAAIGAMVGPVIGYVFKALS